MVRELARDRTPAPGYRVPGAARHNTQSKGHAWWCALFIFLCGSWRRVAAYIIMRYNNYIMHALYERG